MSFKISNYNEPISHVNWRQLHANIIYIPFSETKFANWYKSDQILKQLYRNIIIPDNVTLGAYPVRQVAKYINEIKKEIHGVTIDKTIKKSINKPVIVDLSPVAYVFWNLVKSRGIRYIAADFFNFVHSIYTMLVSHNQQLGANETIVILDFTHEFNELEKFSLYLKLNGYQFPNQIADRYVMIHTRNLYLLLTHDSDLTVNRLVLNKLFKIAKTKEESKIEKIASESSKQETVENKTESKNISNDTHSANINESITPEKLQKVLQAKFNKNITDELELKSLASIVNNFINKHSDIDVNLGDDNEVAELIKTALQNQINNISSKNVASFDELLEEHRRQYVFKDDVEPDKIYNKKVVGLNALKTTDVKWVTSRLRTKIEFDENLDRNINKLIESLDDPNFNFNVLGVEKEIQDDGRSRFNIYKIKIKPEKGTAYTAKLKVPALVHDNYLKIGGNLYAINNQLMQLPIIKKNANTVQLKTNYSITDYSIKSFPQNIKKFEDLIEKFIKIVKVTNKLKEAETMDTATESVLRDFGVPIDEIAKIPYKKIVIKD